MRWKNFTSIDGRDAHDFAMDALRAEGVELRRLTFDMVDAIRRELGRNGDGKREWVRSNRPRRLFDEDGKWFDPESDRDWFDAWSYWLSPKQRDVALMLAAGLRKHQVASRIGVTPTRVSRIVRDIERIYAAFIAPKQKEDETMTMFTAFTEQFRKQDICLFSDFISDAAPFGVVTAATTGLGTVSFSNGNTDASQANQPLGIMTITTTGTLNVVAGVYPFIGVYPTPSATAGGTVNRDFRVGRGEIDFEARLRNITTGPNIVVTAGIGLPNDSAAPTIAADFVGFYAFGGDTTWKAALVIGGVTQRSVDTNLAKTGFHDFRVFLDADANRSAVWANGRKIANFDGQLPNTTGLLPHIEIRDKAASATGSVLAAQSVDVDYMLVKLKAPR